MSQVDEFGRAIPQGGSGEDDLPHYGGSGGQHHHSFRDNRGDRGPPRYNNSEHHYSRGGYYGGGGGSHSQSYHDRDRGDRDRGGHWRSGGVGGRGPRPPVKSEAPSGGDISSSTGTVGAARSQSPSSTGLSQPLPHPSQRYVTDPMLCGFLWKEMQEKLKKEEEGKGEADADEPKEITDTEGKTYDDYRLDYAWTFLKHFFNQHLDDSWFRQMYSPALLVSSAQLERRRCHDEARTFRQELTGSNNAKSKFFGISLTFSASLSPLANPAIPTGHLPSSRSRTLHAINVPPHVTDEHIKQALLPYLSDYLVARHHEEFKKQGKPKRQGEKKFNPSNQEVLDQTLFGLFSTTPYNAHTPINTISGSSPAPANQGVRGGASTAAVAPRGGSVFLHRSVFIVLTSDQLLTCLWQNLSQRDTTNGEVGNAAGGDTHVPRKQDGTTEKSSSSNNHALDLEIDCTDPYGRTEYDADGRGESPPDGLAVPPRKAMVQISRYDAASFTTTVKLSAALSSTSRFPTDYESAQTIARALDVRQHVPVEDQLVSILEKVGRGNDISLALDISLAYLRRVHLYSFYKTSKAESFGDMLAGRSAAAPVQVRDQPENDSEEDFKDDLLGQRLNDAIRRTVEEDTHQWVAAADWFVDEATDTAAHEIAILEERATQDWLQNHYNDDDGRARCSFHFCRKLFKDESFLSKHLLKKHAAYNQAERAKCHDGYMMTKWETAAVRPAVPNILVDCGKQFGKQEAPLAGGPEPRALDPEPALWERKQYQEKLLLERQELRSKRPDHAVGYGSSGGNRDRDRNSSEGPPPSLNSPLSTTRPAHKPAFVDVDDMKEETVEVSFDQVQLNLPLPAAAGKKKKKKRKLL